MSFARYTAGTISAGLLAFSFLFYNGKIKDAEKTRIKIENALNHIEAQPDGEQVVAALAQELHSLDDTPFGRTTFKEIQTKLLALENEPQKTRETKTSEILSAAIQNANMEEAVDTTKLIGAAGISSAAAGGLLLPPLVGGFLISVLFGSGKQGSSKKDTDEEVDSWLKKLLTRDLRDLKVRKLRPDERKIIEASQSRERLPPRGFEKK